MSRILRWIERHPAIRDYLEGAAMVLAPYPEEPRRNLFMKNDVIANIADMHAVGRDLRRAMDEVEQNGIRPTK